MGSTPILAEGRITGTSAHRLVCKVERTEVDRFSAARIEMSRSPRGSFFFFRDNLTRTITDRRGDRCGSTERRALAKSKSYLSC